jgi:7-carboxy-7-deazaguanine synthase
MKEKKLDELCTLLFSPNHKQLKSSDLAEWILTENINVRFQLQIHKYIWGENSRGI